MPDSHPEFFPDPFAPRSRIRPPLRPRPPLRKLVFRLSPKGLFRRDGVNRSPRDLPLDRPPRPRESGD